MPPLNTNPTLSTNGAASKKGVTVLVTGYGPFLDKFPENTSWTIASSLPSKLPPTSSCPYDINIIVPPTALRVSYEEVITKVPPMLPEADLVLHIGLAPARTFFTLEKQASKGPFNKFKDVDGHYCSDSEEKRLFGDCPQSLHPTLDCNDIWERWLTEIKDTSLDLRVGTDDSVGLYLCGFIYYLSLSWFFKHRFAERPVLFLHVPDLASADATTKGVDIAVGLIRSMVVSRKSKGVFDPYGLDSGKDADFRQIALDEADVYHSAGTKAEF